jgi:hypothetical protein
LHSLVNVSLAPGTQWIPKAAGELAGGERAMRKGYR